MKKFLKYRSRFQQNDISRSLVRMILERHLVWWYPTCYAINLPSLQIAHL